HGAVCIVLDCSGSMVTNTYKGKSRFDWAAAALETVLPKLPDGTPLSLFAFIEPHVDQNKPDVQYRPVRKPKAWFKGQLRELMTDVSGFTTEKGGDEAERARKQFIVVKDYRRPGSFTLEPDLAKLAIELDLALRPKLHLEGDAKQWVIVPANYSHEKALR